MEVVRSSPLRTGRLYPPGISWYSFLEAESTQGHMELSDAPKKIPSDRGSILGLSDRHPRPQLFNCMFQNLSLLHWQG